jgi:hypothetical protein
LTVSVVIPPIPNTGRPVVVSAAAAAAGSFRATAVFDGVSNKQPKPRYAGDAVSASAISASECVETPIAIRLGSQRRASAAGQSPCPR